MFLLGGCATYKTVGSFDNYNEVFYGTVNANLFTGGGSFTMEGQRTKMKCQGTASPPTYYPPFALCDGQRGTVQGTCDDGRFLGGIWVASGCTTGMVMGKDSDGQQFMFTFGMNENEAQALIKKKLGRTEGKPDMPVYDPAAVRAKIGYATGTGFLISQDGYLLTNFHVVKGSKKITVKLGTGDTFPAAVVTLDEANDLALLKIARNADFIPLSVGATRDASVGEDVMTYGFPMVSLEGQEPKATFGHINAFSGVRDDIRYLQIDVPIQPGNSGGPLITTHGEVIGITSATLDGLKTLKESGTIPQNINYAVKIDYAIPMINQVGVKTINHATTNAMTFAQLARNVRNSIVLVVAQ